MQLAGIPWWETPWLEASHCDTAVQSWETATHRLNPARTWRRGRYNGRQTASVLLTGDPMLLWSRWKAHKALLPMGSGAVLLVLIWRWHDASVNSFPVLHQPSLRLSKEFKPGKIGRVHFIVHFFFVWTVFFFPCLFSRHRFPIQKQQTNDVTEHNINHGNESGLLVL